MLKRIICSSLYLSGNSSNAQNNNLFVIISVRKRFKCYRARAQPQVDSVHPCYAFASEKRGGTVGGEGKARQRGDPDKGPNHGKRCHSASLTSDSDAPRPSDLRGSARGDPVKGTNHGKRCHPACLTNDS